MSVLILVVDDEEDVELLFRQRFRHDLKAGRFVMESAQSASAALQRISNVGSASLILIFSDIRKLDKLRRLLSGLTPRERQVFERVSRGALNKQIAYELGTTERAVKAHRRNLMEKLGIDSLTQLVLIAERLGMLARPPVSLRPGATQRKKSRRLSTSFWTNYRLAASCVTDYETRRAAHETTSRIVRNRVRRHFGIAATSPLLRRLPLG